MGKEYLVVPKIFDLKFKSPVKEDATCVLPVALGCVHFSIWLHEEVFKTFLLNALNWKQGSRDDACDRLSKSIINHKCM